MTQIIITLEQSDIIAMEKTGDKVAIAKVKTEYIRHVSIILHIKTLSTFGMPYVYIDSSELP